MSDLSVFISILSTARITTSYMQEMRLLCCPAIRFLFTSVYKEHFSLITVELILLVTIFIKKK